MFFFSKEYEMYLHYILCMAAYMVAVFLNSVEFCTFQIFFARKIIEYFDSMPADQSKDFDQKFREFINNNEKLNLLNDGDLVKANVGNGTSVRLLAMKRERERKAKEERLKRLKNAKREELEGRIDQIKGVLGVGGIKKKSHIGHL